MEELIKRLEMTLKRQEEATEKTKTQLKALLDYKAKQTELPLGAKAR